jgi:Na+-translocating ferredoxin:NAD+ oxidoreductase RnfA subunit
MTSVTLLLLLFSGFSLNLFLQLGLGTKELYKALSHPHRHIAYQWVVLFISNITLWVVYTWILSPLALGFTILFLCYPLNVLVLELIEFLIPSTMFHPEESARTFTSASSYAGMGAASFFIIYHLASSMSNAIVLSFGFCAGTLLAHILLQTIYRRIRIENTPHLFRDIPLVCISIGLLSLVVTFLSKIFGL